MFSKVIDRLVNELIASGTIAVGDREVYAFGFRMMITQSAHAFIVVGLGYAFGLFWESLAFLVTYMPLRIYAGGYHASTNARCFLSSIVMILVILSIVKLTPPEFAMSMVSLLVVGSGIVIFRYAPMENKKKPLDELEQVVYRKKALRMIGLIWACMILAALAQYISLLMILALGLAAESILILVEVRENCKAGRSV